VNNKLILNRKMKKIFIFQLQ